MTQKKENGKYAVFFIGGIAGCVAKTAIAPFDRVKIHFQLSSSIFGVFGAIREIYRNEGIYGLYKGHSATLLRIFPYAAINFSAYTNYKMQAEKIYGLEFSELPPAARFLTGSLAGIYLSHNILGVTSVVLTYPLDLIRARLAFYTEHRGTLRMEINKLVQSGDWSLSLYRGLIPTLLGMPVYSGLSFLVFDTLKAKRLAKSSANRLTANERFVFGYIAGAFAQTCSYPLDMIRRRMQVYHVALHLRSSEYRMLSIAKNIYKDQGITGFWKGLSINFIKVAPATGISFMTFEFLKDLLVPENSP